MLGVSSNLPGPPPPGLAPGPLHPSVNMAVPVESNDIDMPLAPASDQDVSQDLMEVDVKEDEDIFELGTLRASVTSDTGNIQPQQTINKLVEWLGNVGINAHHTRMPVKSDCDYATND